MKKVQQKSSIISASSFVLISFIMLLAACGDDESKLVGKWIPEGGGEAPEGFPDDLELFKDGTGICEKMSINWKVDNNRFIVTSSLAGFAMNYQVSDSKLTLTDDKGKIIEYSNFDYLKKQQETRAKTVKKATMKDGRDGKTYETVKIGTQTWMAENLNYNAEGSKCYRNDDSNCVKYGRLYDWNTANNACPKGWHLPTNEEWDKLSRYVDGSTGTSSPYKSPTAGRYLKATSGWRDCGPSGSGESYLCEDTFSFAALPGGYGYPGGGFLDVGNYGGWWSTSENNTNDTYYRRMSNDAYYRRMYYGDEHVGTYYRNNSDLFSVRCIMD